MVVHKILQNMNREIKILTPIISLIIILSLLLFLSEKKIIVFKVKRASAKTSTEINNELPKKIFTGNTVEFNMKIFDWDYEPSKIIVKKGDLIKINLENISDVDHTFTLDKFDYTTVVLQPGQTTTIQFIPDEIGTFTFYCAIYCGDGHNMMNGEIEVYEK